jgi:hypothetical protein
VQVSVKGVVVVNGPVDAVPLVDWPPVHPSEAVQLVALVDVQVSVEALPITTVVGLAVSVTVGPRTTVTVTV